MLMPSKFALPEKEPVIQKVVGLILIMEFAFAPKDPVELLCLIHFGLRLESIFTKRKKQYQF